MQTTQNSISRYFIVLLASLGGFLQSYVTCIIAGALIFISDEFQLTPLKEGNVASIILIGAIAGSLVSGFLADRIGRRLSLLLSCIIYLVTALLSFSVQSFALLMLLRVFTGLAVGITSILVPMYLAEIAPSAKRGAYVTFFQFSVTIGTLVAYFVNLSTAKQGDWRMMFFIAVFPAAFQLIGFFFFPESPRWLLAKGKMEKLEQAARQTGVELSEVQNASVPKANEKLFKAKFLLLLTIGFVLCASQQLSGVNAIVYFTPKIFAEAGYSDPQDAIFATVIVGVVNVLSTFLTIFVIDRFGRRKLLLISQIGVIVTLFFLMLSLATDIAFVDRFAALALILYIFSYSLGFGPIVWVLISEIFPLSVRAKALSFCTFISWISNYIVVLTFPHILATIGSPSTFAIYGAITLLAFLFCLRKIPETRGKSLEELEKELIK
jgi:sugar porter (SP) family MFS transporter